MSPKSPGDWCENSGLLPYTLKESPYSSHSLLLRRVPAEGEGRTVLDVGCGEGYLGRILSARGYTVPGVERAGCPAPPGVELIYADLEQGVPSLGRKFDYILCADVLEHLRSPARLLQQLAEVLAPGGELIASLPNSGNVYFRLNVLFGRFPQEDRGLFDRTHLRFYMWEGWQELFRSAGFSITGVEPTAIPIGLTVPPSYENSAPVRLAESACHGLARIRKTLFAYQFVVTARPTSAA